MKLCPKCEFLYEDDQSFCDMDGNELVNDSGALAFAGTPLSSQPYSEQQALIVKPQRGVAGVKPLTRLSRRFAIAGVILMMLPAVYFTRQMLQPARVPATAAQSLDRSSALAAPPNVTSSAPSSEPRPDSPEVASATFPPASASANRAQPDATPVSAGSSTRKNSSPAVIWLKNGSSIKADEVWEKPDGVWYRQAGLVTFLKRSQVQRIQRGDSPAISQAQPKPRAATTRTQAPVAPEATNEKKDSRVGSFLKKTGRLLKKPFKF